MLYELSVYELYYSVQLPKIVDIVFRRRILLAGFVARL